mgnify:CR=1 FL=1|tara:strand:+ start:53 stop:505 length:453 start_codon:yes stop_codon:yes gene_type:complete
MAESFMGSILPGVSAPSEKTVLGVRAGIEQRQEKRYNSDKLKHTGFLGVIYLPDGTHMTEQSISPRELEGTPYAKRRGIEIPILVPANKKYLEDIASVEDISTLPKSTYEQIKENAVKHAYKRDRINRSPFAEPEEIEFEGKQPTYLKGK